MITLKSDIDVELIQQCGDDAMIASAAKVSTKGIASIDKEDPTNLIWYLMSNRHGSPFEHGSMTVRVHAPIKVWREWHRHRVGWSYNEESGRYKTLDPVFWIPPAHRPMMRSEDFRSAHPRFLIADATQYATMLETLTDIYYRAYMGYKSLIVSGFDRGLARDVLGVGIFSACYCTANPRSIMAFLELRTNVPEATRPSNPLWEIDLAATKLEALFAAYWPITYAAWCDNGRMSP